MLRLLLAALALSAAGIAPVRAAAIQFTNIGLLVDGALTPLDGPVLRLSLEKWRAETGRPTAAIQLGALGGSEENVAQIVLELRTLFEEGLVFELTGERTSCNTLCKVVLDRVHAAAP